MAENLTVYGFLEYYNVLQLAKPSSRNNQHKNKSNALNGDAPTGTHQ
jgi:hypothetical protein